MRKTLLITLLIVSVLTLAACGAATSSPAAAPAETPAAASEPTAAPAVNTAPSLPGSNLQPAETETPADAAPAYDEAKFEAARALIGEDVSALYDAIGEPSDSSYASSCLGPGEDGELYYDGFTVATYREAEKEIVWDVNVNAG